MSDERFQWFKCYPSKLLGALAGMRPDEGYVYWIVCLRIYETEGPCRDTLDALARRTGMNKRRVSDALDRLFRSEKLVRQGDGIMNPFAEIVIKGRTATHELLSRAGQEGATRRWKKTDRNQRRTDSPAKSTPMASDADLDSRGRGTPKKESLADDWPNDFVDQFWERYPKLRRTARKTVAAKLTALRASGTVTWAHLMAGLDRFCQSRDVARGFACAPVVWINGGRWDDEIQNQGGHDAKNGNGGSARGGGYSSLAARIRATRGTVDGGEASPDRVRPGDGRPEPAGDVAPGGPRLL